MRILIQLKDLKFLIELYSIYYFTMYTDFERIHNGFTTVRVTARLSDSVAG